MNTRDNLTPQECLILELIAQGWRNSKIAAELFISPKTVETHLHHIYVKLGVSSRAEAAFHFWTRATGPYPQIHENSDDSAVREA